MPRPWGKSLASLLKVRESGGQAEEVLGEAGKWAGTGGCGDDFGLIQRQQEARECFEQEDQTGQQALSAPQEGKPVSPFLKFYLFGCVGVLVAAHKIFIAGLTQLPAGGILVLQ